MSDKKLPRLPLVLPDPEALEDVTIGLVPSPLHQMTRLLSSASSKLSLSMSAASDSSYVVQLAKTPQNLTPLQRLKLRKAQLSDSISRLKGNRPPLLAVPFDDSDDEEIDDDIQVFNVPVSQALDGLYHKERFTFQSARKHFLVDSTCTSSILSHDSIASSMTSCENDDSYNFHTSFSFSGSKPITTKPNSSSVSLANVSSSADTSFEAPSIPYNPHHSVRSVLSLQNLNLSQDALELTLHFNKDDHSRIIEEHRQRTKLLADFKKINRSSPGNINQPVNPHPERILPLRSNSSAVVMSALPSPPPLLLRVRSSSSSSLPTQLYFSFTRPTWLPPKPPVDKVRHQKESEELIQRAILKESQERSMALDNLEKVKKSKLKDSIKWETAILPNGSTITEEHYREKILTKPVQEMYWRGIPENLRSRIWWKQIGNRLELLNDDCEKYFKKAEMMARHFEAAENLPHVLRAFQKSVLLDIEETYPDHNHFQSDELMVQLSMIVFSVIIYLNETILKALFSHPSDYDHLNTELYFTGLNNLAAVLFYYQKDIYTTFVSLCNIYGNDNVMNTLIAHKLEPLASNRDLLEESLMANCGYRFQKTLENKLPRLSGHLNSVGLRPMDYLPSIFLSLGSNLFNFELSSCMLDIWVFEGDEIMMRCILALLTRVSHKLFGSKQEILDVLGEKHRSFLNDNHSSAIKQEAYKYLKVGYNHDFIELMKSIQI